jgi:hypothetical protein
MLLASGVCSCCWLSRRPLAVAGMSLGGLMLPLAKHLASNPNTLRAEWAAAGSMDLPHGLLLLPPPILPADTERCCQPAAAAVLLAAAYAVRAGVCAAAGLVMGLA